MSANRRYWIVSSGIVIILIAVIVAAIGLNSRSNSNRLALQAPGIPTQAIIATLDPQIAANLTSMPSAPPLTGSAADELNALQAAVEACPDYSAERKSQMKQNIHWLLNPSLLPRDMIIALGNNPTGKLIQGLATFTLSDWGQDGKSADSCLLTIGRKLNTMLVAAGEKPFPIFETVATPVK